eukprot:m.143743 g.143743  ORF g.143743 m.143743 type:complete len:59 (-) comp16025_c0_seq2:202-378(-)
MEFFFCLLSSFLFFFPSPVLSFLSFSLLFLSLFVGDQLEGRDLVYVCSRSDGDLLEVW